MFSHVSSRPAPTSRGQRLRHALVGAGLALLTLTQGANALPPSKSAIERLVDAGEIDKVEAAMAAAHAAYEAGQVDGDYERRLNEVFEAGSPKIAGFVGDWQKAYPESPFAHAAQAWVYWGTGWHIRGEGNPAHTYYKAMQAFDHLMEKANFHAMRANQAEPDLLPATDALLYLTAIRVNRLPHEGYLRARMREQPDGGTLMRGLFGTRRGWGGTFERGQELCGELAPLVAEWGRDARDICKLLLIGKHHQAQGNSPWYVDTLERIDHPVLEPLRHEAILRTHAHRKDWVEDAQRRFNSPDYIDTKYAFRFDERYVGRNPSAELVTPRVVPRARLWAETRLQRDPHDRRALKILLEAESFRRYSQDHIGTVFRRFDARDHATRAVYIKRLLALEPYNPVLWDALRGTLSFDVSEAGYVLRGKLHANQIAYSNHAPNALWQLMQSYVGKGRTLDNLSQVADSAEVRNFAMTADRDAMFFCPMVRAARLASAVCAHQPRDWSCGELAKQSEAYTVTMTALWERQACEREFTAPLEELVFEPVAVDLSVEDGS